MAIAATACDRSDESHGVRRTDDGVGPRNAISVTLVPSGTAYIDSDALDSLEIGPRGPYRLYKTQTWDEVVGWWYTEGDDVPVGTTPEAARRKASPATTATR
ncbi:MAG: hypothetical protein QOD57_4642 [Actinomycetota bacterium]|nr:hypothetical protein [Actinomycetota bacterium]